MPKELADRLFNIVYISQFATKLEFLVIRKLSILVQHFKY